MRQLRTTTDWTLCVKRALLFVLLVLRIPVVVHSVEAPRTYADLGRLTPLLQERSKLPHPEEREQSRNVPNGLDHSERVRGVHERVKRSLSTDFSVYIENRCRGLLILLTGQWAVTLIPSTFVIAFAYALTDYWKQRRSDSWNLYKSYHREGQRGNPGFAHVLDWISIDTDGGIDKIATLGDWQKGPRDKLTRRIQFCLKAGGACVNSCIIVFLNVHILLGCLHHLHGGSSAELPMAIKKYIELTADHQGKYRLLNMPEVGFISFVELGAVFFLVALTVFRSLFFMWNCHNHEMAFPAFTSLWHLFEGAQSLSVFSVLKLFSMCHPALVGRRFKEYLSIHGAKGGFHSFLAAAYFIITRLFAAVLSMLAFGVKLAMVSIQFYVVGARPAIVPDSLDFFWRWAVVIQLFVQTFSILDVEEVLKWRLFAIISGGEDCNPENMETLVMQVYRARISQAIFDVYWSTGRRFDFFVIFMTLNDVDLQLLLFEEDKRKKNSRILQIERDARSMSKLNAGMA